MNHGTRKKLTKTTPKYINGRKNYLETTSHIAIPSILTQKFPNRRNWSTIWVSAFVTICFLTETVHASKNNTLPL